MDQKKQKNNLIPTNLHRYVHAEFGTIGNKSSSTTKQFMYNDGCRRILLELIIMIFFITRHWSGAWSVGKYWKSYQGVTGHRRWPWLKEVLWYRKCTRPFCVTYCFQVSCGFHILQNIMHSYSLNQVYTHLDIYIFYNRHC